MTNEEKAKELAYNKIICDGSWECLGDAKKNKNICIRCREYHIAMEAAQWKDKQYKVLIDYIVELTNDCGGDCEHFSECMLEWCEKNCGSHNPNFNSECIKNWIKKQNEIKK